MITDLRHPACAGYEVDETLRFYKMLDIEEAFRLHNDDGSLRRTGRGVRSDANSRLPTRG